MKFLRFWFFLRFFIKLTDKLDLVKANCDNIIMISICAKFFSWYFIETTGEILKAWKNFLWFNLNYFSVATLLKTYFSPWRRYYSSYGKVFKVWENIEVLIFNTMSRIIGAVLRTFLIIAGLFLELIIIILGIIILAAWLILPLGLTVCFLFGLWLIIF